MLDTNGHDALAHLEARVRALEVTLAHHLDQMLLLVQAVERTQHEHDDLRRALAAATRRQPAE